MVLRTTDSSRIEWSLLSKIPPTHPPSPALSRWRSELLDTHPVTKAILQMDSRKTGQLVLRDRINTLYKDHKIYVQGLRLYFYVY